MVSIKNPNAFREAITGKITCGKFGKKTPLTPLGHREVPARVCSTTPVICDLMRTALNQRQTFCTLLQRIPLSQSIRTSAVNQRELWMWVCVCVCMCVCVCVCVHATVTSMSFLCFLFFLWWMLKYASCSFMWFLYFQVGEVCEERCLSLFFCSDALRTGYCTKWDRVAGTGADSITSIKSCLSTVMNK